MTRSEPDTGSFGLAAIVAPAAPALFVLLIFGLMAIFASFPLITLAWAVGLALLVSYGAFFLLAFPILLVFRPSIRRLSLVVHLSGAAIGALSFTAFLSFFSVSMLGNAQPPPISFSGIIFGAFFGLSVSVPFMLLSKNRI